MSRLNSTFLKIIIMLLSLQLSVDVLCLPQRNVNEGYKYLPWQRRPNNDDEKNFIKSPMLGITPRSSFSVKSRLFEPLEKISNLLNFKQPTVIPNDNARSIDQENFEISHTNITKRSDKLKSDCSNITKLRCEEETELLDEIFRKPDTFNNDIKTKVISTAETSITEDYESTTLTDEDPLNRMAPIIAPALATMLGG